MDHHTYVGRPVPLQYGQHMHDVVLNPQISTPTTDDPDNPDDIRPLFEKDGALTKVLHQWLSYMYKLTASAALYTRAQISIFEKDPKTKIAFYITDNKLKPNILNAWPSNPPVLHINTEWYSAIPDEIFGLIGSYISEFMVYKLFSLFNKKISASLSVIHQMVQIPMDTIRKDNNSLWLLGYLWSIDQFISLSERLVIVFQVLKSTSGSYNDRMNYLLVAAKLRNVDAMRLLVIDFFQPSITTNKLQSVTTCELWYSDPEFQNDYVIKSFLKTHGDSNTDAVTQDDPKALLDKEVCDFLNYENDANQEVKMLSANLFEFWKIPSQSNVVVCRHFISSMLQNPSMYVRLIKQQIEMMNSEETNPLVIVLKFVMIVFRQHLEYTGIKLNTDLNVSYVQYIRLSIMQFIFAVLDQGKVDCDISYTYFIDTLSYILKSEDNPDAIIYDYFVSYTWNSLKVVSCCKLSPLVNMYLHPMHTCLVSFIDRLFLELQNYSNVIQARIALLHGIMKSVTNYIEDTLLSNDYIELEVRAMYCNNTEAQSLLTLLSPKLSLWFDCFDAACKKYVSNFSSLRVCSRQFLGGIVEATQAEIWFNPNTIVWPVDQVVGMTNVGITDAGMTTVRQTMISPFSGPFTANVTRDAKGYILAVTNQNGDIIGGDVKVPQTSVDAKTLNVNEKHYTIGNNISGAIVYPDVDNKSNADVDTNVGVDISNNIAFDKDNDDNSSVHNPSDHNPSDHNPFDHNPSDHDEFNDDDDSSSETEIVTILPVSFSNARKKR